MKNNTTSNIQIKNIKNEPTFKITYTKSLFLKENSNQPQTEKIISDYLLNSILFYYYCGGHDFRVGHLYYIT